MSVETLLALDEHSELLALAHERWSGWGQRDERLAVVESFGDLRAWLRQAAPQDKDGVLLALGALAAPEGGDDLAAAAALVHLLMPGAVRLAQSARRFQPTGWVPYCDRGAIEESTDAHVAAQLWLEARSFPWRQSRNVAANILFRVRSDVWVELGDLEQLKRRQRVWAHTMVFDIHSYGDVMSAAMNRDPATGAAPPETLGWRGAHDSAAELVELLAWATESRVISAQDRHLLDCLVEEAWAEGGVAGRARCALSGFAGLAISARVGERVGLAGVTVRRRSSRAIKALAAAAGTYTEFVA